MRKIILAAAIAASALGLAACSEATEEKSADAVEAMAADAEANVDNAGEAIEGAADESAANIEAAADNAADEAVKTTDDIGNAAASVAEEAEEAAEYAAIIACTHKKGGALRCRPFCCLPSGPPDRPSRQAPPSGKVSGVI